MIMKSWSQNRKDQRRKELLLDKWDKLVWKISQWLICFKSCFYTVTIIDIYLSPLPGLSLFMDSNKMKGNGERNWDLSECWLCNQAEYTEKFQTSGKKGGKEEVSNVQNWDSLSEVNASTMFLTGYYNSSCSSVWSKKYNYSSNRVFSWLAIMLGSGITNVCYYHCLQPQR